MIVNWNAEEVLRECLLSLEQENAACPLQIIVVDNASSDGSVAMIRKSYAQVELIEAQRNLGFAAATNLGVARAVADHILLLNPDTRIHTGAISHMLRLAQNTTRVGAVGPKLLNSDGSLQRSCWRGFPGILESWVDALYLWKLPWLPFVHQSEYRPDELMAVREVDRILGACMLIPRRAWEEAGPLDEGFFLFSEETDWCFRVKKAGMKIYFTPAAVVTHHGQRSSRQLPAESAAQYYKSYARFFRKNETGGAVREVLLRTSFSCACATRFLLWKTRAIFATTESGKAQKNKMAQGYLQTLKEIPNLA